jgi:RNA polymerase sigma-70 factor (ECF subfamily)
MLASKPKAAFLIGAAKEPDPILLVHVQEYLRQQGGGGIPSETRIEAWNRFYHLYDPLLKFYIRRLFSSLSEQDSQDCCQEVWKVLVVGLPDFQRNPRRARFTTWLRTLVRNKAVDILRRRKRAMLDNDGEAALASLASHHDDDPALIVERGNARDAFHQAFSRLILQLPRRTEFILRQRWIEGRSVEDIAESLGLTVVQVRTLNHRGLKRLRQWMAQESGAASTPRAS